MEAVRNRGERASGDESERRPVADKAITVSIDVEVGTRQDQRVKVIAVDFVGRGTVAARAHKIRLEIAQEKR